jgi:hypothetical protein
MKDHLRAIKQNVADSPSDQNAEDRGEKDKVGYLSLAERPVAFPGEPFQEEKCGDEACQIRSAIPTDTDISIEPNQKWIEMMNVEREAHRRHERTGVAQEFKAFGSSGAGRAKNSARPSIRFFTELNRAGFELWMLPRAERLKTGADTP